MRTRPIHVARCLAGRIAPTPGTRSHIRTPIWLLLIVAALAVALPARGAVQSHYNGTWTQLGLLGVPPNLTRDCPAIYDSKRDRVIALEVTGAPTVFDFSLGTDAWVKPSWPSGPAGTTTVRAVYDATNDRMVVITDAMQAYALPLSAPSTWVPLYPAGVPPTPRPYFAVAYDSQRNRLLLYGGGPNGSTSYNDLWALTLSGSATWSQIVPTGTAPAPTWGPLAMYDPSRDQVIVGMGAPGSGYSPVSSLYAVGLAGTPTWTPIVTQAPQPPGEMLTAAIYDPAADALEMFTSYPNLTSDTWGLSLASPQSWYQLASSGTRPPSRWSFNLLYRSQSPAMILLGGFNASGNRGDLWSLSLAPQVPPGPVVTSFTPAGGGVGTPVTIHGTSLYRVTAIDFGGVPAPVLSAVTAELQTEVPAGATTGPIHVSSPEGSSTSPTNFFVGEVPVVGRVAPDSARAGEQIFVYGQHFTGLTKVQLGGTGTAPFVFVSDTALTVTVDTLATSGSVSVTTPAATGTGPATFIVISDDPRPRLLSVADVRGDQGGKVTLRWRASDFDQARYSVITGYRVWRAAASSYVQSLPEADRARFVSGASLMRGGLADPVYWESIADLPSAFLKAYAYTAATLSDSTAADTTYTSFFVQATTASPYVLYNSSPDSGYSVDNLSPPAPASFVAQHTDQGLALHWTPSRAPDVLTYRLYRGATLEFVPSPASLIATTADTGYVEPASSGQFCYKVDAVDIHGNAGRFAIIAPSGATDGVATFMVARIAAGTVDLTWYVSSSEAAAFRVERCTPSTGWEQLGMAESDGQGYVHFADSGALPDNRYGYRLGLVDSYGTVTYAGVGWVDVPGPVHSPLLRVPNPALQGSVVALVTVAPGRTARVELYDLAGRLIQSRAVAGSAAVQRVTFAPIVDLPPGIYLVRATLDKTVTARVAVMH